MGYKRRRIGQIYTEAFLIFFLQIFTRIFMADCYGVARTDCMSGVDLYFRIRLFYYTYSISMAGCPAFLFVGIVYFIYFQNDYRSDRIVGSRI